MGWPTIVAVIREPRSYAVLLFSWMAIGLTADGLGPRRAQDIVAVFTFLLLGIVIAAVPANEKRQVIACVLIATGLEILFSIVWGIYVYRFENLPLYVPPGHGLVYLLALRLSKVPFIAFAPRRAAIWTSVLAGIWVLAGLLVLGPVDSVGLLLYPVLLWFLWRTPRATVFAGAFVATSVLEILGTSLGTWTWAAEVPGIGAPQGNPPAAIAAGYCLLDAGVIVACRYVLPRIEAALWRPDAAAQARSAIGRALPASRDREPGALPGRHPSAHVDRLDPVAAGDGTGAARATAG